MSKEHVEFGFTDEEMVTPKGVEHPTDEPVLDMTNVYYTVKYNEWDKEFETHYMKMTIVENKQFDSYYDVCKYMAKWAILPMDCEILKMKDGCPYPTRIKSIPICYKDWKAFKEQFGYE